MKKFFLSLLAALAFTGGALAQNQQTYSDATTRAGLACIRGDIVSGATYNHAQLINPAGSTVFVYVDSILHGPMTGIVSIMQYNTALTDIGAGFNKDILGTACTGHIRGNTNAAVLGTGNYHYANSGGGNTPVTITFNPPLRLGAGEGIVLVSPAGVSNYFTYQWRELKQ